MLSTAHTQQPRRKSLGWLPRSELARREAEAHALEVASQPPPSKASIRNKMRKREGIVPPTKKPAGGRRRSASAYDIIGLNDPVEFERLISASIKPQVRSRPRSEEGQRSKSTPKTRSVPDASPKFPSQAGFIPTDRGFAHDSDRAQRQKRLPRDAERLAGVERTLESLKNSYFPRSKIDPLRQGNASGPQVQRRVAGGSFTVYKGQSTKLQERTKNHQRQMSMLKQNCVLTEDELSRIQTSFVSSSEDGNPCISFGRFLQIMKELGVGQSDAEVDFFRRLYRIFDADKNGSVDFEELCTGLSSLLAGSTRAKLRLFFDMFYNDEAKKKNGERGLSKYMVYKMFMAIAQFFTRKDANAGGGDLEGSIPMDGWTHVFSKMDVDGDGCVSFDELYTHIIQHDHLKAFLDSAVLRLGDDPEKNQGRGSSGGLARALKESALTNKVHAKRSNYHKPWQHMAKKFHAIHLVDPATMRTGSGNSTRTCPASFTEQSDALGDQPLHPGSRTTSGLSRASSSDSVDSVRSNNTAPPLMSPHKDALDAVKRTGSNHSRISRSQSAEDSPQTWLLKQRHVKQWGQQAASTGKSVVLFR